MTAKGKPIPNDLMDGALEIARELTPEYPDPWTTHDLRVAFTAQLAREAWAIRQAREREDANRA